MTTYQETNTVAGSTQEVMKVQYTAKTHTSGGRRGGVSRSDDGRLDVKLSSPAVPGTGTNPEQLFAAGWSACFISAMGVVANKMKVKLPAEVTVDAEIDLCNSGDVYFLRARLNVSLPGLEGEVAQAIVDATHGQTCAYLRLHKGSEAAAEFQKILDHKSASWGSAWRFPNWDCTLRSPTWDWRAPPCSRATKRRRGNPSRTSSHFGKTPTRISLSSSKQRKNTRHYTSFHAKESLFLRWFPNGRTTVKIGCCPTRSSPEPNGSSRAMQLAGAGREHRCARCAAHLVAEPGTSFAPALPRSRRRTGARSPRWVASRRGFFLPVRVLSRMFRGKLLAFLRQSYRRKEPCFSGTLAILSEPRAFHSLLHTLRRREWVVYSKPPFGGPEHVLKYLARYTHRVAISNGRCSVSITDRCAFAGETPGTTTAAAS